MPKQTGPLSTDYALVADRITLFYERYPEGRIETDLISRDQDAIVFRARVYRKETSTAPAATGWASEEPGDGEINEVACLENTETSAVGRALANLGFTASTRRPSYEEMAKADRARRRAAARGEVLQFKADVATEVIRLLESAKRLGFAAERARSLVRRVSERSVSTYSLHRVERALRKWLEERDQSRFSPPSARPDGG